MVAARLPTMLPTQLGARIGAFSIGGRDLNYVYNAAELDALLQANGVAAGDVVSTWDAIWPTLTDPDTASPYANADASWNQIYAQGGILKQDIIDAIPSGYDPSVSSRNWWDASDETSITDTTGDVSAIADKKGSFNLTASGPPRTGDTTQNGLNVIDLDGAGDALNNGSFTTTNDFVLSMAVVIGTVDSSFDALISMDASNDWQLDSSNSSQFDGEFKGSGNIGGTTLTGGPYSGFTIVSLVFDSVATTITIYVDGTLRGTVASYDPGDLDSPVNLIFFQNRSGTDELAGSFCEAVYDTNTGNRSLIESYFTDKWTP